MATIEFRMRVTLTTSGQQWHPTEVRNVDGRNFVPITSTDRTLATFCGIRKRGGFKCFDWIDDVRKLRNDACLTCLEQAARATMDRDGIVTKTMMRNVSCEALPKIIDVTLPPVVNGIVRCDEQVITMLFDRNPKRSMWIEALEGNFVYMSIAVPTSRRVGAKRDLDGQWKETQVKHVHFNAQRGSLIIRFRDDEGRFRSRSKKIKLSGTGDDSEMLRQEALAFKQEVMD